MMQRLILIVSIPLIVFTLTIERAAASADENPLSDNEKPVEPKIKEIRVEMVRQLTGIVRRNEVT